MMLPKRPNRNAGAVKLERARRASRRALAQFSLEVMESRQLLSLSPTTTVLSASAATLLQGQTLTLTATVSDGDPVTGGIVTFTDGSSTIGTGTVTNGTATLAISSLAVGQHQLMADYGGTGSDSPSTSNSGYIQTVLAASHPADVAIDSAGDLYIVEETNNEVVKVTPGGVTTVVAGNGSAGYSGNGGQATAARLNSPRSVAIDSSGNLYIADGGNYAVRKVSTGGVISTVAGTGSYGYSGNGGQATSAQIGTPTGVAVDSSGNLYIVDSSNSAIRKVTTGGVITNVAGNGTSGYSGDGGQATAAELSYPTTVTVDASGNLYIVDNGNEIIRKVSTGGVITTIAGTHNSYGSSGDGGPATSARLAAPYGVAVDSSGDIFISDASYRVREVTPDGTIHTYAGNGTSGDTGDDGPATSASVSAFNVTTDSSGDLFIEDFSDNVIREVVPALILPVTGNPTSTVLTASAPSIVAGQSLTLTVTVSDAASDSISGGTVTFKDGTTTLGTATLANGSASLPVSNLAVGQHDLTASYGGQTDYLASASGLTPTSTIETIAGTGAEGYSGDGGPATTAELSSPYSVAYNSQGDLFIADFGANVVREVTPAGVISTIAGTGTAGYTGDGGQATQAELNNPAGLAVDASGDVFIADFGNHVIREVNTDGVISTIAGTGTSGYSGDEGPATAATLTNPEGLSIDAQGNLFVADNGDHTIREITYYGFMYTVAGDGTAGYSGDGGQATSAEVQPTNVIVDSHGDLFIADPTNNVVREVTPDGIIHTVAGTGDQGYSGDGGAATSATLDAPEQLALDAAGDLFIADFGNNVVREVTTDAIIHTVAGTGTAGSSGDGGPATSATLNLPYGLVFDATGDLIAGEYGSHVIRQVDAFVPVTVIAVPPTHFSVTGISGNVTAGSTETITVTDENLDDTTDTGYTGTVHLTSTDGQAVLGGDATLTNGVGTFSVTFKTSGTQSVTATDTDNSGITGSETGITVTPSTVTYFTVSNGAGEVAGGVEPESVTAYDQYGNVATGYAGTVHITSSDPQAVIPSDATLTNGVGTFDVTLKTAGSQSITATDTVAPAITGSQTGLEVTPGSAASLTLTGAVPDRVGGVEVVTATAHDAYGNVATGYGGTLAITSSDSSAVLPSNPTATSGVATFLVTFESPGTQSITATDTVSSGITGSETGISVGYPTSTTLTTSASSPTTVQSLTLTATITGQTTPNSGTVSFYQGSTLLGTSNVSNGAATYTINRLSAGSYSFSAVYSGVPGQYLGGYAGLTGANTIKTFAGNGTQGTTGNGGQATAAELNLPSGVVFDAAGNMYIADPGAHVVRKVTPAGIISTYAGTGTAGNTGDSGQATAARLYAPYGLAIDSAGDLFVADDGNNTVRKITPGGVITTVAGTGTGGSTGNGGQATAARLDEPTGVAVDGSGDLFIADSYNNEIREVTTDGVIHDVAGTGTAGNTGDGGQATAAQIHDPYMVAVYDGNVYFTDFGNSKVREITPDGVIHDVAGTGTGGDTGDGGAATAAEIDGPIGLAFNAVGDLFIADYDDSTVREVTTDGKIQTVAGSHDAFEYGSSKGDGGPGSAAGFYYLQGLAVDANGDLYIADNYNASIREMGSAVIVNVTQAPATYFTVTASPTGAVAGSERTITVTAFDADGNVVTGYNGTVHFTSTDGQASLPVNATLTNGVGTFTVMLKTAGTDSITATDTVNSGLTGSDSSDIVTPAAATQFVDTGATDETAGGVETVTVTAEDPYGNIATGYDGTVAITSSDGQAVLPANATLTNGVGTFNVLLKTAGIDSITATDTVNTAITGSDSGINVTPGAAIQFVDTGATDETAGGVETVTVTAEDPYGNIATGYDGTVAITSSDGQAVLPANATLTNGVGTFNVLLKTAGIDSITATDTVNTAITGSDSGINVTPATASTYTITYPSTPGTEVTVTVTARDVYGNVATGYSGTVQISSSDTGAILPGNVTLTAGVGTFVIGFSAVGTPTVTATDTVNGSLTDTQAINVTDNIVTGTAYLDQNANGAQDSVESGLAGRIVFIDLNHDGTLDVGDPTATTDANGNFTLSDPQSGTPIVLEETSQDSSYRDVVDQTATVDGQIKIGVVPVSPIAPVPVVPTPFTPGPNVDASAAFVQALYHAVLGRSGDPSELSYWEAKMTAGMNRQQVAASFINSHEHRTMEVDSYYQQFLHRTPDASETSYYVNELTSGMSETTVVLAFLNSPEYQAVNTDPTTFVADLYDEVLSRYGEPSELTYWENQMTSGMSRHEVERRFVESNEAMSALVTSDYAAYLHRATDPLASGWVTLLTTTGTSPSFVATQILASAEFYKDVQSGGL